MKVADMHCDTILAILRGKEQGKEISRYPSWEEVLQCVSGEKSDRKKVLIIENFH